MDMFSSEAMTALVQVIGIDLALAGDNAIVIGLAAAGLPKDQRSKAILIGIIAATVLRIFFALITTTLLGITGLLLAGGILLLWVCWKMYRELREGHGSQTDDAVEALADSDLNRDGTVAGRAPRKTLRQAAQSGRIIRGSLIVRSCWCPVSRARSGLASGSAAVQGGR
jgi:YjbE family integral membrane protein